MRVTISFDLDWPTADALQFWWFDNGKPMKTYSLMAASREALEERLREIEKKYRDHIPGGKK